MSTLRIISRSDRPFRDRQEAGQLLAQELRNLAGQKAVVLGIPRGGVIVARELARALDADLDILLARKLRTPAHPELALGAIAEGGRFFLNIRLINQLDISDAYIEREKRYQEAQIAQLSSKIRGVLPKIPLREREVIVTDDGVATGATTMVALWAVRQEDPKKLILAVPVGTEEAIKKLAEDADEVICLRAPPAFTAVGQFFMSFEEISDDDVLRILEEECVKRGMNPRFAKGDTQEHLC